MVISDLRINKSRLWQSLEEMAQTCSCTLPCGWRV